MYVYIYICVWFRSKHWIAQEITIHGLQQENEISPGKMEPETLEAQGEQSPCDHWNTSRWDPGVVYKPIAIIIDYCRL